MNRRAFLLSATGFSFAGFLAFLKPLGLVEEFEIDGTHFIDDQVGQLLISKDDGESWDVAIKFHPNLKILSITKNISGWKLMVGIYDHQFSLLSLDGTHWKSV